MEFRNTGPKLSEETISAFEAHFQVTLPEDYRDFLLEHNGGRPEKNFCFDFVETGYQETESILAEFFSMYDLEYDYSENLATVFTNIRKDAFAPPYLMPIAYDDFGNLILLAVAGDDLGKVCFANHELTDPATGYYVMSPVADTFTEFIGKLYRYEE